MQEDTTTALVWALPPELLLHIFKKLALRVCSHWKALAYDKTLWLPLDFSQDDWRQRKDLSAAFPRIVDMVCNDVVELNLTYCDHNVDALALMAIGQCVNLRWLSLAWCRQTTDEVLERITERCQSITRLDLRGCAQLSLRALATLKRLPNLESLVLDYCVLPSPRALGKLAVQCPSLQQLSTFFLRFQQEPRYNVWDDCASKCRYGLFKWTDRDESAKEDQPKKPCAQDALNRITWETDLWKQAYEQSFDTTTAPDIQIAAAAARAGREGKLLLLCIDLCKFMHVPGDWSIRLQHYCTHNRLLWNKLNETFVWLHLDESVARNEEEVPVQVDDEESESILEGVVPSWTRLIRSLPEWPYLLVLDSNAKLLSRQRTGPLERYDRYDHHTMFEFIANWQRFLQTGEKPAPIDRDFSDDVEPAYECLPQQESYLQFDTSSDSDVEQDDNMDEV